MESAPFLVEVSEEQVRRERQKARDLRASQWWKRKRATGLCYHCGVRFAPRELTMDHLIPIIAAANSTKGNLVPRAARNRDTARKYQLPF